MAIWINTMYGEGLMRSRDERNKFAEETGKWIEQIDVSFQELKPAELDWLIREKKAIEAIKDDVLRGRRNAQLLMNEDYQRWIVRWTPKIGQEGSLSPNPRENDPHVQETTSA